ncbi:TPM domain-containing protein [Candidatus Chloroploca sp. Khr17]|uniref:TPM domain-containing protein n=1 Tax=Candidatus Chloroploca sp. Khr17 TaxID=2496869 RepID=UPI00101C414F|nr:TPM domain-containing protein [Candidatus Chloroploca sp. Khr17]
MRHVLRLVAAIALLLLLAVPAFAQGRVLITDPDGRLDRGEVEQAARPLLNRGATVAVYIVPNGDADDFTERMIDDGVGRPDGTMLNALIAIYVAENPPYSEIAYGDDWARALGVNENAEAIRRTELNPGLSSGDFTGGVVSALGAIENAIVNPPTPGGGTTVNFDPTPVVLGVGGLAAAGAGAFAFTRRRRTAQARAAAQQRLKDAREAASLKITDLGQRFRNADDKAKFDAVSYAKADINRLATLQKAALADFVKAQQTFKETGDQLERHEKPSNAQFEEAAVQYDQVSVACDTVSDELAVIEQLRRDLDEQARIAQEELDRAKKA